MAGEESERIKFMFSERMRDLENNLIASLNGWKIPIIPTLFGPLRI